jgi:subtilase family serine protease
MAAFPGLPSESFGRGRGWIVCAGTAEQVENAFHTELRRYQTGGKEHFAAAVAPSVPEGFASLIGTIRGLDDFYLEVPQTIAFRYTAANGRDRCVSNRNRSEPRPNTFFFLRNL